MDANTVPLVASDLREVSESKNNDSRESAADLDFPIVLSGQFETAGDEDWFRMDWRKDVPLTIECLPFPRWSPALPIVSIVNADGARSGIGERRAIGSWNNPH